MGRLIMLLLVALAIAMSVPDSREVLVEKATPVMDDFRSRLVPRRLEAMADQLTARARRGEGFPGNFEGWLERSYSGVAEDPWGNYYYLNVGRRGDFTVGSMGPDGERNTPDDLTLDRRLETR